MDDSQPTQPVSFATHPDRYQNLRLEVDGPVARILLDIREDGGLRPGYELKLNSYDLGVDIELADAVERLRFEHPEVTAVVITSAQEGVFSAGANIFMLGSSAHGFKVNFCKFTNETRLSIEDATQSSGQTYVAALNGIASGGGYELPLACEEIYLVDDRRSAVALPEVPYLGVLPGTGGLTRVVDKRKVRRDLADVFCTLAEGVKGKRAVQWGLVDGTFPASQFADRVAERVREIAGAGRPDRKGIALEPLRVEEGEDGALVYEHLTLSFGPVPRTATLTLRGPGEVVDLPADPAQLGCGWYPLALFRQLDDALLRLRFNYPEVGLILLESEGDPAKVLELDAQLEARSDHWLVREVRHKIKRVLKRLDLTARSTFALMRPTSCFAGTLLEVALAADRTYMLDEEGAGLALSPLNGGAYPMSNGLSRLETRFLGAPGRPAELLGARRGASRARRRTPPGCSRPWPTSSTGRTTSAWRSRSGPASRPTP